MNKIVTALFLSVVLLAPTADAATRPQTDQSRSVANSAKVCTMIQTINGKVWKDVYYISSTENYHTFLDPSAMPGDNLFLAHRNSLARWNVRIMHVEPGDLMVGVFDKTGRTLLKIKH